MILSLNDYSRVSYLSGNLLLISNEVHGRLNTGLYGDNRSILAAEVLLFLFSAVVVFLLGRSIRNLGR